MANKDGIVSIGFDYKKELDEVCATIEKELNNLGGDINLSDGIKKQMAEVKKMITDMKKDIGSSFDKITETKLDTKTFESFKKDVNKRIREINKEVTTLKEQFSTLDGSANVSGIVQQFANLKKYVEDSNASISEFISNSEKLGKSVIISPNLNTDTLKNDVVEIRKLLTDLNKEDLDFGYTNKSTKELTNDLEGLVDKYYRITDLIDEMKTSMNGMDATTQEYKNQQVQLSKLSLELIKCSAQIDDLFGAKNAEKINVDKIISIDELDDIFTHVKDISSKIKLEAKNIIESIELSNTAVKNVSNNATSDLSNKSNIEVHISTKQSTINKQLDEMIDNLQQRAANKPIIAPVKLRVDSEYEKTTKDASASALTENQINEARKDVESVVPGLEKAFNNSMRIATNKAVENAKESIKAIREFFETNPITVHLTIPEDERLKIGKSILSEDGKTTVDISGQVDKARKSVKGLSEDLEKSQLLIKENAQNAKNLSLEKLVNSLSETMTQFSELKGIISSIQNMESTIARASGISSTNELVEQWSVVEKTIINATKLDGDFRKNANIGKIVSEYQKYIDMGGTNALSSIDKIKDSETTINSILSKMKELKSQDVENDSIQKLSVDLDGVITKFDELISTVKTATNALYKIIKQGSVSDLDKQWSSISNKFKSIADESGKINLNKQKTDIKELMDMYQRYENAGGTNSLMSLTDNVETLRKLDKEYQKLNQTQSVDNSSTIKKESELFKSVEKSVDSLTTAIGDTKVQAINVEATAMEDAAEREIIAIRSILDNLDLVVSRLKDIKGIKLPKIEVKNVDVVEKAVESLENTGNKSNISSVNVQQEKSQQTIINAMAKVREHTVISRREEEERQRLAQNNAINKALEQEYQERQKNIKAAEKQAELDKQKALAFTKSASDKLSSAISKYSYGDSSDATAMMKQMNRGLSNFGDLSNVEDNVTQLSSVIDKIIADLKVSHEHSLSALNQEIKSEQELQAQKDAFHKKNISAIDLEIQKREEESKMVSSALKAQMEERQKQLSSMESSLKSYQDKAFDLSIKPDEANRFPEYQAQLDSINKAISDYSIHINSLQNKGVIDPSDIDEANRLKSIIEELLKNTKKFSSGDKGFTNIGADKVLEKINTILEQNSRMSKTAKDQIKAYYNEIYSGNPTRPLNEILDSVYKIVQQEREAGRAGKSWLDVFKDKKIYSFIGQAASMFSFYDLINLGREGFQTIREFDTALTEMKKVSDETTQSLKNYQSTTFDVGDAVGATAKKIQNSTADWLRLGESIDEAAESAKVSNILLNVSEFENIDEATKSLVSMSQAYQELEKIDIVNKINNIGNNFSISTDELARGMQNAAAVLKTQGNDIDKAISLITAGNAITQNAEKTSAGIRTIALRIAGTEEAKDELQEMGEDVDDFVVKTSSKTQQIIKDYTAVASNAYKGIDVLDANGNLRDTYDILLDIARIYKEIQEEDKKAGTNRAQALVEELAGKNRSNIASSILLNPQLLEDVYKTSQNSANSAQKELDSYLDSIDGRHFAMLYRNM